MVELNSAKAPLNDGAHPNASRATLAFVVRMLGYYVVLNGVYFLIPIATLVARALGSLTCLPWPIALVVLALTTPFQLVGLSADNGQTAARVEMER